MLSERLLELRKKSKLTQVELSSRLKMARTTYSGYELGTSEPDNDTLEKIADFYGVTTDNLFGRTGNPSIEETEREKENRELTDLINNIDDPIKKEQAISYLRFLANSPTDGAKK